MLYCLINPSSSSRKGIRTWKKIEKYIKAENIPYKPIITKSIDDVTNAARSLSSDGEIKDVLIVGGDGTLNAFLNGIHHTDLLQIGYLPVGSGNDFARGMSITQNYKEELDLILHDRKKRHVHYGTVDYPSGRNHRFFVSCGIGYDARVCYHADHSRFKRIFNLFGCGKLIYLFTGVRYLLNARTFEGSLFVDEQKVVEGDSFLFTSFHMLPYEGGGFKFCPDQHPENDMIYLCAAVGIPKWKIPFIIPQALMGTHVYCKGVHILQGREARISSDYPQYVHTDGETDYRYDRISVRVSRDTITFLN